jgi:hypothetical protein
MRMKIYLSSTYTDLKHHRGVVGRALRKAHYGVVMMEEYAARDQRVEFACQGDVAACDLYVGLFAWRHGHVPREDNPEGLSVTEMEYAAAGAKPMTRLTFLLRDEARWPAARRDGDPRRISDLRSRLKQRCSAYFSSADELAKEVLAALRVHESSQLAKQLEAMDVIQKAQEMGPSYIMDIEKKLNVLGGEFFISLRLGPTPWWNTRLFLVAALAQEFGRPRGFAFADGKGRFLIMASPSEIRHRLALRWSALEEAYALFRRESPSREMIAEGLWRYPEFVNQAWKAEEQEVKHELSTRDLEYELGIVRNAEVVDVSGKGQLFLQREILGRQTPYVALVRDGRLEGIVDRGDLAQRVAQAALVGLA